MTSPRGRLDGRAVELVCEDGRVAAVRPVVGRADDPVLRPGLVDLQVNGAAGLDLTAAPGAVWRVGSWLARTGVTGFLPTLVSPDAATVAAAMAVLDDGPPTGWVGAVPLGWHVEGPLLASARAGIHPPTSLRRPPPDEVGTWTAPRVRVVTLAPEVVGADEVAEALLGQGVVVAAGHSDATDVEAVAAFDRGVRLVTHLGNAMAPLAARAPGLAGAALVDPRVTVGVIADGVHTAPGWLRLVAAAAGDRVVLASDLSAAAGTDGVATVGGGVDVRDVGGAARDVRGRLAGATRPLVGDVHVWARLAGVGFDDAWTAASTRPAAVCGIAQAAGLVVGAPADVVATDDHGRVVRAWVGGVPVDALT